MRKLLLTFFLLTSLSVCAFSGSLLFSLKGGVAIELNPFSLRELSFQYSKATSGWPPKWSIRIVQDSFDNFLWGENTRWGMAWIPHIMSGRLTVQTGAGLSLSNSYEIKNRLSFDLFLKLKYSFLLIELDTMFFRDGLFNKNFIGLDIGFKLGRQKLDFLLGLGGLLNTDYSEMITYSALCGGVTYEF